MASHRLLLLPGDGIGPEVMAEVRKLIGWMNGRGMGAFESEEALVGGCCYDAHGVAVTGHARIIDAGTQGGKAGRSRAAGLRHAARAG